MQFAVLSSGSVGNCSLLMTDQHKILMDAGLSGKKTKELLAKVGVAIEDLDMVFLSHDHGDHSGGMGVLMRRYPQLNAFSNTVTWKYLEETGKIGCLPKDQINVIEPGQTKCYGDLEVTAFATSHDAAQPQYYVFSSGGKRLACLTDTGYVSEEVEYEIQDADAYLLEFNYDDLMLRSGPYPWSLQQRVRSDHGHLSNEQAAETLARVISSKTKHVFMAHRSQQNNLNYLARDVAEEVLAARDADVASDLELHDTEPMTPSSLINL
ncbi:MBL fold metallo-hydrolase [Lactobacillus delbrueckii subsp. bulgaricus]|nr:MBL fold hydrolase [Lactobacillus delbrueckii subsp. bulgaricus]